MRKTSRRRSLLEMLVCALLVAAFAGQPAIGDKDAGKIGVATAATSGASSKAAPARHSRARSARVHSVRAAQAAQSAQPPTPPSDPAPAEPVATSMSTPPPPPPPPVAPPGTDTTPPPPPPVEPAASAPEAGAGDSAPTPPVPTPAPAAEQQAAPRALVPGDAGARPAASRGASAVETPADAQPETIQPASGPTGASAAQALPVGGTAALGPLAPPQTPERGGDATPSANLGITAPTGTAQAFERSRGNTTTRTPGQPSAHTGTSGDQAIPQNAIAEPLNTPATEAITRNRVRSDAGYESSPPAPTLSDAPPLTDPASGAPSDGALARAVKAAGPAAQIALAVLGVLVLLLGAHTLVAAARTRRLRHQRERLMADIGLLQAALLPAVPSRLGALQTTVAYRPADGPAAGGDFYDAFALPDGRVGLLLGDVSGHGRQALAKTTLVRFTIRAHLEAGLSPREALAISGRSLDGRLSDDFATVIAAIHDPVEGTLTYASAGHPPPLVLGPSAHKAVTASSAPPIGVGFPTGQRQTVLPMPEGATVAVYSDGLLEARIEGKPLGSDRLATWLAELGPEATAKALLELVVQRADRVPDDLAAVVVHAAPGASAPAARIEQLKLDVLDTEGPNLDGFLEGAGVSPADRAITGRHVSEQLSITGGVVVEVRTGEHPVVSVAPIGDETAITPRAGMRAR
ncbi:MAG: phosphoserine phosphatase RsbU/P [Solirubrobacteraceae bacterium]|nr:phosphoserine phosphatase RsbU/P [Solirubrobacteraceae bacterium]